MMTHEEILEEIYRLLREHLEVKKSLGPETDLLRDLELDSLKHLTFVVELENRFRVRFDSGDEEEIRTLDEVAILVSQRLAEAGAREEARNG